LWRASHPPSYWAASNVFTSLQRGTKTSSGRIDRRFHPRPTSSPRVDRAKGTRPVVTTTLPVVQTPGRSPSTIRDSRRLATQAWRG
jgi:hypothetical protein